MDASTTNLADGIEGLYGGPSPEINKHSATGIVGGRDDGDGLGSNVYASLEAGIVDGWKALSNPPGRHVAGEVKEYMGVAM
jgi:hypothetical protein